jgi:hypothetical protein
MPTLISAAGGNLQGILLDGIEQWSALVGKEASPRTEVLLQYDEVKRTYALRKNNWKITNGTSYEPQGPITNISFVYYYLTCVLLREKFPCRERNIKDATHTENVNEAYRSHHCNETNGRALVEAVSVRFATAAAPVTSCGTGVGFLRVLQFPCQGFHRLIHTHNHSPAAGAIGS